MQVWEIYDPCFRLSILLPLLQDVKALNGLGWDKWRSIHVFDWVYYCLCCKMTRLWMDLVEISEQLWISLILLSVSRAPFVRTWESQWMLLSTYGGPGYERMTWIWMLYATREVLGMWCRGGLFIFWIDWMNAASKSSTLDCLRATEFLCIYGFVAIWAMCRSGRYDAYVLHCSIKLAAIFLRFAARWL